MPNAGIDRIEGIETRDDGTAALRIRIAAVPDKGRANAAASALLSQMFGVPKSVVVLVSGATARLKTVRIGGDPARLAATIDGLGGD